MKLFLGVATLVACISAVQLLEPASGPVTQSRSRNTSVAIFGGLLPHLRSHKWSHRRGASQQLDFVSGPARDNPIQVATTLHGSIFDWLDVAGILCLVLVYAVLHEELEELEKDVDSEPLQDQTSTSTLPNKWMDASARECPESVYGAAMSVTIEALACHSWSLVWLDLLTHIYLGLNGVLQLTLIYHINVFLARPDQSNLEKLYAIFQSETYADGTFNEAQWDSWSDADTKDHLCDFPFARPWFAYILLTIWTVHMMVDLRETMEYTGHWWSLPHPKGEADEESVATEDGDVVVESAETFLKLRIIVLVLIPKYIVAVCLWFFGSNWLLCSDSLEDLVVNTVALGFITNIDELIYMVMVPTTVKTMTRMAKIRVAAIGSQTAEFRRSVVEMVALAILVLVVPIVYIRHQYILPNYDWDLVIACRNYVA